MRAIRGRAALLVVALVALALVTVPASEDQRELLTARQVSHSEPAALSLSSMLGHQSRPNIVMIMADDMREDDLRFMPRTRRLIGGQGVRFENSFSPFPLCCPARSSFLTGQYTHNHKVWSHSDPWGFRALDDSSTLPVWLKQVGYNTVFLGKYLNGYGSQRLEDGRPSARYVPPGWTDWRGAIDGGLGRNHPQDGGTYRYFDTTLNVDGRLRGNPGRYQTTVFGNHTERIIGRYAKSPRPFFLWASYVAPHGGGPREADDPRPILRADGRVQKLDTPARPTGVRGRFDIVVRKAPGLPGEHDVSDKPGFVRRMPPLSAAEKAALREVTRQRAESLWILDKQVARTVRVLRRTGELDDTILAFTSDNGYFLGEHRMRQGKISPYEPSLAVPLLVRGPGIPKGRVRQDPFLTIDFAPTFLEAAGARPRAADGQSMLGVLRGRDRGWDRPVLTDTGPRRVRSDTRESDNWLEQGDGARTPRRYSVGVRTARYLYVEHVTGERELYDNLRDSSQSNNLAGRAGTVDTAGAQAELADVLHRLRDCRAESCRAPLPAALRRP